MLKKNDKFYFFKKIILVFILLQFFISFSSALSVTPASISMDFTPGFHKTFDYHVSGTKPDKIYVLYLEGDLAQYATLNKDELPGDGDFKVFLSLPNSFDTPGRHILHVGVKESVDEELSGNMIGTAIEIKVLVAVHVPYPGKYVEMSFSSEDVNIGEPLEFKIDAINRGRDDVTISPRVEVFSNQSSEKLETLSLEDRQLAPTEKISLHKFMNTSSFNPGRYNARAVIEYGGTSPATAENFFRLGGLLIEIRNYTNKIVLGQSIQKFNIDLESGWNDKIDGVYANVLFSNQTGEILSFKTSSAELIPWERKTIIGYFDTTNFQKGIYNANITLFYYGKDVGKTSSKIVDVEFVEEGEGTMIILISIATGIVLIAGVIFFFLKRKKINKK